MLMANRTARERGMLLKGTRRAWYHMRALRGITIGGPEVNKDSHRSSRRDPCILIAVTILAVISVLPTYSQYSAGCITCMAKWR